MGAAPKKHDPLQRGSVQEWRCVPERYVDEAALISRSTPRFRACLLASARRLLIGGIKANPYQGQTLLCLASTEPRWEASAVTALDFSSRLIRSGVLPNAFAAEVIVSAAANAMTHSTHIDSALLKLGLSAKTSTHGCVHFQRSQSSPARMGHEPATARSGVGLRRTYSEQGTSLRPQDNPNISYGPYTCLSFACEYPRGKQVRLAESIPLEIHSDDLPDYWRFVAGGEHSLERLEHRTRGRRKSPFGT